MRYCIIFGITLIVVLIITFYPRKYLMKYDGQITIDYSDFINEELWSYELSNDNLLLKQNIDNKWVFTPNNNGKVTLTFYYDKKEESFKYKITYELVIKNNIIIWKSGEALGLLDYPNPY